MSSTGPDLEQEKFESDVRFRERELQLKEREIALSEKKENNSVWNNALFLALLGAFVAAIGNIGATLFSAREQRDLENRKQKALIALEENKAEASRVLAMINTGGDPEKAANNLRFLVNTNLIEGGDLRERIESYLKKKNYGVATSSGSELSIRGIPGEGLLVCRLHQAVEPKTLEDSITKTMHDPPLNAVSNWTSSDDGEHGVSSALTNQSGAREQLQVTFYIIRKSDSTLISASVGARSEVFMSIMPTGDTRGHIVNRNVWFKYMKPVQGALEAALGAIDNGVMCSPEDVADSNVVP